LIHFYKRKKGMEETETSLAKFEEAEDEWDTVAEITPQFHGVSDRTDNNSENAEAVISPLTTVDSVVEYINKSDMEEYLNQVKHGPDKKGFRKLFSCLLGPPSLPPHLRQTQKLVQATAFIAFKNEVPLHLAMLRTLYRQLTGSTIDCPRYGGHWEDIGFQGSDPATDLRGVGLLGLVQALYLVITPEMFPFARDVYQLSRKDSQEFPLMVLSLNITRITLHILRDGLLNRFISLEDDVWTTVNFFYCSLLYHVYHIWKSQHKTISSSGFVLQEAERFARANVGLVIKNFERFLNLNYSIAVKQSAREQIHKYTKVKVGRS